MIRCEIGLEVARARSDVFAFVDDTKKAPLWLSRGVGIEQTSPPPKRAGTTLRYAYKEGGRAGTMEGAVTAYEKDRQLTMRYTDRMFDLEVGFRFETSAVGTRVDHAIELTPKPFMARLMAPVIRGASRKQIAHDTAALKRLLESGA